MKRMYTTDFSNPITGFRDYKMMFFIPQRRACQSITFRASIFAVPTLMTMKNGYSRSVWERYRSVKIIDTL